jgi:hypothetical protein
MAINASVSARSRIHAINESPSTHEHWRLSTSSTPRGIVDNTR